MAGKHRSHWVAWVVGIFFVSVVVTLVMLAVGITSAAKGIANIPIDNCTGLSSQSAASVSPKLAAAPQPWRNQVDPTTNTIISTSVPATANWVRLDETGHILASGQWGSTIRAADACGPTPTATVVVGKTGYSCMDATAIPVLGDSATPLYCVQAQE